jgi:hypothetical protein
MIENALACLAVACAVLIGVILSGWPPPKASWLIGAGIVLLRLAWHYLWVVWANRLRTSANLRQSDIDEVLRVVGVGGVRPYRVLSIHAEAGETDVVQVVVGHRAGRLSGHGETLVLSRRRDGWQITESRDWMA